MDLTAEILSELKAFNRNIKYLKERDKELKQMNWVKASVVMKATGWNYEGMRRARENGYVNWRKDESGFFYDLSSINKIHFKNQS